jgi:hypothetical protein
MYTQTIPVLQIISPHNTNVGTALGAMSCKTKAVGMCWTAKAAYGHVLQDSTCQEIPGI